MQEQGYEKCEDYQECQGCDYHIILEQKIRKIEKLLKEYNEFLKIKMEPMENNIDMYNNKKKRKRNDDNAGR